jgi:GT2 family glycosyltransferase
MKPSVSIVIPTWNGIDLLRRFLPSVAHAARTYSTHSNAPVEILIVDDASTDATIEWLSEEGFIEKRASDTDRSPDQIFTLRYVRNEINRGFGETCNRGFDSAEHNLIFLLNNDVEVDENAIAPLVECFDDRQVFAAHCRVFNLDSNREVGTGKLGGYSRGFIRVHGSYRIDQKNESKITSGESPLYSMFAGGGSAMFDRTKFLELGGFETLLSPFYWEDVELSYRAWKRGYRVLYEPRSLARHQISSTIGKLGRRRVRMIEQRNRLMFHWINLHDRGLITSHIFWLMFLVITAPLRLQPMFVISVFEALKRLPEILRRRREEKLRGIQTDREVFKLFEALRRRPDVLIDE